MDVLVTEWSRVQREGLGLGCWVAGGLIDRRLMLQSLEGGLGRAHCDCSLTPEVLMMLKVTRQVISAASGVHSEDVGWAPCPSPGELCNTWLLDMVLPPADRLSIHQLTPRPVWPPKDHRMKRCR